MTPLLLSYGFRPLFLCVVATGLVFIPWWTAVFFGLVDYHGPIGPIAWHGHEMVFGFVGAAIGGFLLTAVANWTNRPAVSGLPLALIVASWLLARLVLAIDLGLGTVPLLLVDSAYWILLTSIIGREIVLGGNWRNLKVVVILGGFIVLTVLFHASDTFGLATDTGRMALRAAIMLTALLITLIGGRIVPAFTGNWLRANKPQSNLPAAFGHLDRATFAVTILTAVAWTIAPTHVITALLALAAGALQLARLWRWQGHRTLTEPLVFVLHAGYAWLGVGFLLIGCSALIPSVAASAGTHALGAGAMATMIMAVSSRAAMGHTGRPLIAGWILSMSFAAIHLAALLRVGASFDMRLLTASALVWTLAFVLFAMHVGPMLLRQSRST